MRSQPAAPRTLGRWLDVIATALGGIEPPGS